MTSLGRALGLTVMAAGLGGWAGAQWGLAHQAHGSGLHGLLHHRLQLSGAQDARIAELEAGFAPRQQAFDAEMRAANRDLAAALSHEHAYGPDAQAAVQHFHHAMADLQDATIRHVLDMRAVLTPDQARIFDRTIDQALTAPAP